MEVKDPEIPEHDAKPSTKELAPDKEITGEIQGVNQRVKEVAFQKRVGIKPYKVLKPSLEKLAKWKQEIDDSIHKIKSGDLEELMKKKNGKYIGNPADIKSMIETEKFSEKDIILLAIGFFILKNKSPWGQGNIRTKVLKGGEVDMEELLTEEGRTNCIDGAVIAKELASHYGISGQVKTSLLHGFFQTDEGQVLDAFYGHARGGVFTTVKQYNEFVKKMAIRDRFGIRLNFLRGKSEE